MFDRDSFIPVAETRFHDLRHVVSTGSTNSDLVQLAEELAANGRPIVPTVLVADRQTAGKGRRGRIWESGRPTGLWVSVLVPAPQPITDLGWLLASAGIALVDALRPLGVAAGLKWPNDIVIPTEGGDRKLAGMLSESTSCGGQVHGIVIGLGCNIFNNLVDLGRFVLQHCKTGAFDEYVRQLGAVFDSLLQEFFTIIADYQRCENKHSQRQDYHEIGTDF